MATKFVDPATRLAALGDLRKCLEVAQAIGELEVITTDLAPHVEPAPEVHVIAHAPSRRGLLAIFGARTTPLALLGGAHYSAGDTRSVPLSKCAVNRQRGQNAN